MATNRGLPTLRANLRELPPSAWILAGGSFINRFGSFALVFLALYVRSRGYSAEAAGAAVAAYGVGALLSALAGGAAADRLGRTETIALSMFSSAGATLALSQARSFAALVLVSVAAGCASELYRPASAALLADVVPTEQRVTAYAAYRLAINVGFAAGPALGGFLAERSFTLLFVADALTSVVFGVVAMIALPRVPPPRALDERPREFMHALRGDRAFRLLLIATTAGAFVYFQQLSALPLYMEARGLSTATFGALMSLNGLIVVVFELPLTSVTQRLPPRPVIAAGLILVGAGFGLTAFANSVVLLAITVCVWTVGEIVNAPVASAYVADLAPEHLRGRYLGAYGFTWAVALVLAPSVGALILAWNENVLWLICALLGAAGAAFALAARRPSIDRNSDGQVVDG